MRRSKKISGSIASANKHIVDILIEERAPRLSRSVFWPLIGKLLRALLNYKQARALADALKDLSGVEALAYVSQLLRLRVKTSGLENVPENGSFIIICNHPTGVADGVALQNAIGPIRPDLCFFANADAHRVCPGFHDVLIPVAWPASKRTVTSSKRTLRLAHQAFDQCRPVAIFPAGALARRIDGKIQDPVWEHSAVSLAQRQKLPILPIHIEGPFPHLFHFFDRFSNELRDITLFHELLNKTGKNYRLKVGPLIEPDDLQGPASETTERLKNYVEQALSDSSEAPLPFVWFDRPAKLRRRPK